MLRRFYGVQDPWNMPLAEWVALIHDWIVLWELENATEKTPEWDRRQAYMRKLKHGYTTRRTIRSD